MISRFIYFLRALVKKPLKIGLISYYYPKSASNIDNGVSIHTYYLSNKLAELGCEIHVFTKGDKNYKKTSFPGEGKLVIHGIDTRFDCPVTDVVMKKRMSYFVFDNKIINEVTKEHSSSRFDLIHTHGWLTAGAFISKYLNNVKWVHTFHAIEKNRLKFMSKDEQKYFKIARWVESTINYADALIAVSENLKKEILINYPVKKEKVFYIPNGVDLKLFNPNYNGATNNQILYVGRFSLEKGIDFIPDIAKEVLGKNEKAKFFILATGNIAPSIEKINEEFKNLSKKYPERFILEREAKSREELAELYKKSIICFQPSRYEAFGLVVLEAMACGKAIICSNKGGLPEVVKNAGIIVPLNKKKFIENILKLISDYRLRERYSRRGIKLARNLSWNSVGKKTLMLYKEIIKK